MDMKSSSAKGWLVQSLAEFLGTAMFLYLAVGGADAVTQGVGMGASTLGQAFAFGISLTVMSWAFFRISGAHFNPAISFSSLITGHISIPKFVLYFIAQLLGAMVGVSLARGTTPSNESIGQINELMYGESIARGFWLEFFLTMILCFVYHIPLGGAILAAAFHILFRYMDYDHYTVGIDAENQAQYERAQAAYRDGVVAGHHDAVHHGAHHGTTTSNGTLPR
ncbi:hypothetical protein BGX31_009638 [Mortierella sp. GBA43]|nr:hypothetical protein BGX31_009638 [Mortierella sp. GBA43]